ncbi:MAG: hypothetical protein KDA73_12660 [Rhodobacteraceae bacterium]|nr:hypothetical protein [Paracoccaceae bacterium]
MPGFILHLGATVLCAHGGQATPLVTQPRVTVSGQPVATLTSPYAVAGCALPPVSGGPCVTAQYVTSATRVTVNGQPVLLQDSQAICAPTGTPLLPLVVQSRVTAI